jgi:hypothetical protein
MKYLTSCLFSKNSDQKKPKNEQNVEELQVKFNELKERFAAIKTYSDLKQPMIAKGAAFDFDASSKLKVSQGGGLPLVTDEDQNKKQHWQTVTDNAEANYPRVKELLRELTEANYQPAKDFKRDNKNALATAEDSLGGVCSCWPHLGH